MSNSGDIYNQKTDLKLGSRNLSMILHNEEIMQLSKYIKEFIEEKIADQDNMKD